ncbi:MAG: integrin alpha [Myxococcota bacterium]
MGDVIVQAVFGASGSRWSRTYIVFGKEENISAPLSAIAAGYGGFVLDTEDAGPRPGWSSSGAGDVNGDGLGDIIVGTPGAETTYVVFGKADTAAVALSSVATGLGGFALDGEGDYVGFSVAGAGDVNGDGLDDVVATAVDQADASAAYVVFGKVDTSAVLLSALNAGEGGYAVEAEADANYWIGRVSAAGDVNGDGLGDIVVGASQASANGPNSGRAYVVFGRSDTTGVQLRDVAAGIGGFMLDGEAIGGHAGRVVSGAGDVNGDGLDDIVVGATGLDTAGSGVGRGYVVFGKVDTVAVQLSSVVAGAGGFVIDEKAPDDLALAVSGAGDVNGDGLADVVLGASDAFAEGSEAGRAYVVFGKSDTDAVQLSAIAAGVGGFALDGEETEDGAGRGVGGAGDVNGDGLDDVVVGAPEAGSNGRIYVVFGDEDSPRTR